MKKKRKVIKRKLKLTKFEKLLYGFAVFIVVISPLAIVFSQATLSKINYDVEKLRGEVNTEQKKNESLSMKLSELASLDKIKEVAESKGLRYNDNNIRLVDNTAE
ncbi:MAG: cell division protein FtsL [Bacilli bacterium]|nr:cell division protein FtsL [Bacilli bacterium]